MENTIYVPVKCKERLPAIPENQKEANVVLTDKGPMMPAFLKWVIDTNHNPPEFWLEKRSLPQEVKSAEEFLKEKGVKVNHLIPNDEGLANCFELPSLLTDYALQFKREAKMSFEEWFKKYGERIAYTVGNLKEAFESGQRSLPSENTKEVEIKKHIGDWPTCSKCEKIVTDNYKFCPECGSKINWK
jgi:hypothetical protein